MMDNPFKDHVYPMELLGAFGGLKSGLYRQSCAASASVELLPVKHSCPWQPSDTYVVGSYGAGGA